MHKNIIFIGSEAYGNYSGAHECIGAFIPEGNYIASQSTLDLVFEGEWFHELDGKHSEVRGDLMIESFSDIKQAVQFAKEKEVNFESYVLEERLCDYEDGDDFTKDDIKEIELAASRVAMQIENYMKDFKEVSFYLATEHIKEVEEFVANLTK